MILFPAVDIRGGRAVRLVQGDYDRETAFDADPVEAAQRFKSQGASWLHVVDLDGARAGRPANLDQIARIAATGVPVQVGGGLRDSGAVEAVLAAGVERVILGTAALTDPGLVEALCAAHPGRVLVSIDVRDGKVRHSGWEAGGEAAATDVIAEMARRGVRGFIYTPIEVDGTLEGPGLDGLHEIAESVAAHDGELIYSGGIGTLDHLRRLAAAGLPAITGVIVGRALYEGAFTVAEGQAVLGRG
jgi:phosphoribosylformimino-5-aminoimidazole carboxamide ribotide isomerase